MISARIETAISSGVIAPRSRPAGTLSFASLSPSIPLLANDALSASTFFLLPTKATYCAFDRKRRLKRGFITAPLRRDHDEARTGLFHGQRIAFDTPVGIGEGGLLRGRRADGQREPEPAGELRDRDRHRARAADDDLRPRQHRLDEHVHGPAMLPQR